MKTGAYATIAQTSSKEYGKPGRIVKVENPAERSASWNNSRTRRLLETYRETKDPQIKAQIVGEYMNLASVYAWKYSGRGVDYEDLRQEGYVGLLKAIDGFDPSRGVQFQTYAIYFVEGYIRQYFRDKIWTCHVPRSVKKMALRVKELSNELGRMPTRQEVASMCDISENKADDVLAATQTLNLIGFYHNTKCAGTNPAFDNDVPYIDEELERVPLRLDIQDARERVLSKTEAFIVKLYYEDELSQREIAQKLGTYQMMVSRSLQRSASKLDAALSDKQMVS